jgi:hypothetical protein
MKCSKDNDILDGHFRRVKMGVDGKKDMLRPVFYMFVRASLAVYKSESWLDQLRTWNVVH